MNNRQDLRPQLTHQDFRFFGGEKDLERLRQKFENQHYLSFKNILSSNMLSKINQQLEVTNFQETIQNVGEEQTSMNVKLHNTLGFILSDPNFWKFIQNVTGCEKIMAVGGRIYKMSSTKKYHFSWHDDFAEEKRQVGISINLSPTIYRGGLFQIRERQKDSRIWQFANIGFGDAIVFKIGLNLEHRVTPVTGGNHKMAFAGWFKG